MIFEQIKVAGSDNFSYLIGDENTGEAIVVDAPSPIGSILAAVKKHKLRVKYIVNTHGHRDHTSGNAELAKATGAKIAAHISARHQKDISLKDQDTLAIGSIPIIVLHTPGHSPDSICLEFDRKILTGDTLFVGECGRTDISGGNTAQLYDSLFNKIARLEDDYEVYPGHDYGKKPSSTIGLEKKTNYTLEPRSLEEFIEFMSEP